MSNGYGTSSRARFDAVPASEDFQKIVVRACSI
jgi:hypothetical protein